MIDIHVGMLIIGALFVAVLAGLHVPIALALLSFIGAWLLRGDLDIALAFTAQAAKDAIASHEFGVVPLFVLMGLIVAKAGLGQELFDFAERCFRRLRGGLGMATVFANTIFASITGISLASAAVFSRIAVPEMVRLRYSLRFAAGVVAGSSVLGMLIPPSLLMIVFAFLSEQSVGALFIGGILPGIILAALFIGCIAVMARFAPHTVGQAAIEHGQARAPHEGLLRSLAVIGPVAALVLMVLGGLYLGFFTATESGAVGAAGALVIAVLRRRIGWRDLWALSMETGRITVSVLFLIVCANLYSRTLSLSGLPFEFVTAVTESGAGALVFVLAYIAIIIVLGFILDSVSILLIVVPIVLPVAVGMQLDLIWFGIVTIVAVEIGLLTPPFGLSAYAVRSSIPVPDVKLWDVFAGAMPFVMMMVVLLVLLLLFPGIVLSAR